MSGSDEREPVQTDRDDPRNAVVPPSGSKATAPTAGEDDEDALDLRDLDVHGVEGVVARLRRDGDADPTPVAPPKRRIRAGRSPLLSIVVTVFGCWLLTTMFADFRYWLQSSEPRDLGDAGELAKNGRMPDGLHDTYARISGTPDVRHAARMTTSKNYVGYLRINEGGGSLFAAVPRSKDEPIRDEFESTFIGRMKQLDRDPGTAWLEQYLRDENIVRTIDAEPAALWKALEGGSDHIDTVEGARKLGAGERIRLVVHPPDARVQLGIGSYDAAEAERRVAALGYPYISMGKGRAFHSFLARIPEAERAAAEAKLQEGIEVPAVNADPKLGAAVLPGTVAFSGTPEAFGLRGDDVTVARESEAEPLIYDVVGKRLEARSIADGINAIPRAWVSIVRVEQPIVLDRSGYIVVVGETPADQRLRGILWLVVAALVGMNVASLVAWVRRMRAEPAAEA